MKKTFKNLLCSTALLLGATAATAQGLQNIIVEEFHTVTAADAAAYNDVHGGGSYPLVAGMKTYRVYVDMAPNYRLASVFALPGQAVAFNTTTYFWNDDNYGGEFAAPTRRMDEGTLFDTYVTFNVTGTAGTPAGCGSALRQVGVPRADDTNGDLTTCSVYPNFTGADGNIADPLNHPNPAFLGVVDTEGLTGQTNTFGFTDQLYYVLPAPTGPDPSGTNRILIGQFTTDGVFSFNFNVALLLPSPSTAAEEYVHANATGSQIFSSLLTYPSACTPVQITGTTSNSPICSNETLNLGVTATGTEPIAYTWTGAGSIANGGSPNATVTGAVSGNYNIAVSNGCGNVNQNVAVTVTPTSSNTTTENACDSYTWSVNGQTYTTSGQYTSVIGCATEILNLTITQSSSNTTTESACDSYTWSVNGQTYTTSGQYTSVSGCNTEILNLTITPSTSNTTTESACDSYTWSVNGQTYTTSGQYTSVSGCNTEILNLTITPSTSNTTTESACDSYTWSVNGQTYTASGQYTSVIGCATEILNLTILTGGTNTTTESACDSYTWSVNGQTYTTSGQYTAVTGCSTEILNLTITPSSSNTTTESACDSYTWSVNGQTYTTSGQYTSVSGCNTEILNLTITPSSSNTTTESACDSYTWSVNGQTYTASGQYTSVSGCNTEILNLTILTGGTNTTTESACDSYTWSVNGQTYTTSGQYTTVTGCSTEILNLTITPSSSNTTTESACDSYTWSVNGQTYTTSGQYTSVSGCNTEILNLTIINSGTNTTAESACDSYTWSVNGQTYTASGQYTAVTGCSTEILNLTITPSSSNTATASACGSYTWSVNGQTYTASGQYTSVVGCATEILNLTVSVPGTACDDGDENTINDQLNAACQCVGQPVGPGCNFNEVELAVVNDGVSIVSYEVREQGTNALVANGTVNQPVGASVEDICLPDGCYYLIVSDDGGDGITGGGYVLRLLAGGRLIDNAGNMTVSPSQIDGGEGFCLPIGIDRLIGTSCDKLDWRTAPCQAEYVVANSNAAVSSQFGVNNANSGYQLWWYNPNGGYSFKRFQSHSTANGLAASATRACHFRVNAWTGNQLQEGVLYNVKVRGRVAGDYLPWGGACRFRIDNAAAQCPLTRLNDIAGNQFFSCGVTRPVGTNGTVQAIQARRVQPNCSWLYANRYQFRFRIPSEGFELVKASTTWGVNTVGLSCGKTYEVDVRASFDGGQTWCATGSTWGPICLLNTAACPGSGSLNMGLAGNVDAVQGETLRMYPNPNGGEQVFLSLEGIDASVETVSVDIYDAFGKRVSARTIAINDGFVNTVLQLNGELSNGLYMVTITAGDRQFVERLVVQP